MAKLNSGDVVEIRTSKSLTYAHFVCRHKIYGALLRVFRGFYNERPSDFVEIVSASPAFECFFPLSVAVKRGIVSIVGNVDLSDQAKMFPIFRNGVVDPSSGKVKVWWLWDGTKEWCVGKLTMEQRKLPILGVWNDTLLIERIESGWTPEADPT